MGRARGAVAVVVGLLPWCGAACGGGGGAPSDGAGLLDKPPPGVPAFSIRVRATTAPFPHQDGLSGQTASGTRGGIRSLSLLRHVGDRSPVRLFDRGADPVEVGYDDGDDTLVGWVGTGILADGRFTLVRMVHTHSRYRLEGSLHEWGTRTDGVFDNLYVMSDRTRVDGEVRDAGYYRSRFLGGPVPRVFSGSDGVVPAWSSTAGAWGVVEQGAWAVYFPADLEVRPTDWDGLTLVITVNMHDAFRWRDNPLPPGYRAGVFDAETWTYESVAQFGGNRFDVTLERP